MKGILILACSFLLSAQAISQSKSMFSNSEVQDDLDFLYNSLIDAHYNVFAYTSEDEFKSTYQTIKKSIQKDSLNLLQATSYLQQLTAAVKNGHTAIEFPGQAYAEFVYNGGKVFPLELAFENRKALVRKNWSSNANIQPGQEVLSINDRSIKDVVDSISKQISAERSYFTQVKIEMYSFPRYYWQVFGEQENFSIEISENKDVDSYTLEAIKALDEYEMKRKEVMNAKMKLDFLSEAAYLNPGNFGGDEKIYQIFIDSAFTEINNRKTENLIIDLRNNMGGDNSFSDYLVSYFADKPFQWNSSFTLKTSKFLKENVRKTRDTTNPFWKEALEHADGEIYDYAFDSYQPQPASRRFEGKVYVLVNRQSHSQSAVTAAQIQDYDFGTIVGEETGDYPSLYASIFGFELPNTGINVSVSKGYMVRVNGSTAEEGVIPDIPIRDHLLDENDEILNILLGKLEAD
ncbi:S41 family peptidase [Gramella sp. GC03-9]|uniref:S41 family peptidase n=1 Tax=Christiangramia oceanisediminis TaxID=2920386 RepID=A0A9X2I8Z4_9FLAO|nr:S41 family peptidase [Gramella oceanisediminis]MCP9199974.1 S41 family peptidase [Gramella oceanisediminis]